MVFWNHKLMQVNNRMKKKFERFDEKEYMTRILHGIK